MAYRRAIRFECWRVLGGTGQRRGSRQDIERRIYRVVWLWRVRGEERWRGVAVRRVLDRMACRMFRTE